MPRCGHRNRGREFWCDRGIAPQRKGVKHVVERIHGLLRGWGEAGVAIAVDLRQRPDIAAGDVALGCFIDPIVDPQPEKFGIGRIEHETGEVVLKGRRVAEPGIDKGIGRPPRRIRSAGEPVVVFDLQPVESRCRPAGWQVRPKQFGPGGVENGRRECQQQHL